MMMSNMGSRRHRLAASVALAAALGAIACGGQALAQTPVSTAGQIPSAPVGGALGASDNLTVNLMRLLVQQKVITQEAADQLMAEARRQTAEARAAEPGQGPIATNLPPPGAGVTRIPYVPEIVKNQIRDEVRQEVLAQAKAENWAQPNAIPAWTQRLQISGDVRLRYESDLYSKNNDPQVINFAALNANGPVDINPNTGLAGVPILNTRRDRDNQLIIRGRLDILANPSDQVTADIRLASGSTNSPVSTSQMLGGGLTKKNVWLDRAYIDFHPTSWIGGTFGRMPNPFFSTDLVYDTDLNFDGAAAHTAFGLWPSHGLSLFATGGAFLTDYQDVNFPSNNTSDQKSPTRAKWMFGSQFGVDWKNSLFNWKTGVGYYSFQNSQGILSQPCALYTGITQCSTDFSRPAFMQKGNTLFLIRNITPDPSVLAGASPLPQYAGLMFAYHVLDLTSTLDLSLGHGKHLELTGDYARNLAYRFSKVCRYGENGLPVNNITAPVAADTDVCMGETGPNAPHFNSSPTAFMVRATYGDPDPDRLGQWNFSVGYKRLGPDAVLDAYTDADFHLGGTNAKGYFLMGALGIAQGTNIQFRWFSADEIYGSPLSVDVGQIDINTKF